MTPILCGPPTPARFGCTTTSTGVLAFGLSTCKFKESPSGVSRIVPIKSAMARCAAAEFGDDVMDNGEPVV